MNNSNAMPEEELNRLINEAAAHSEFLRAWEKEAAAIDKMLDSSGFPASPDENRTSEVAAPRSRPVPKGWSHAIAASTGSKAGSQPGDRPTPEAWSVADGDSGTESRDWWMMRRAADGSMLYVGTPVRVKAAPEGNVVVIDLPKSLLRGTVLYSSPDVAVVQLLPQNG